MSDTDTTAEEATDPQKVRFAAMNLLARREHSMAELQQKLARRFDDAAVVECELQRLREENLQSDERFVQSFVRQRIQRGYGPLRIERDCRAKGVSRDELERAFSAAEVDWSELAQEVLQKKFGPHPPQTLQEKARRVRFLQYRGFTSEHCNIELSR